MRPTVESDMPISRAIVLRDQCVALTGLLCVVFSITWATTVAGIDGVRPGLGASLSKPAMPSLRKRSRHRFTVRAKPASARLFRGFEALWQPTTQYDCASQPEKQSTVHEHYVPDRGGPIPPELLASQLAYSSPHHKMKSDVYRTLFVTDYTSSLANIPPSCKALRSGNCGGHNLRHPEIGAVHRHRGAYSQADKRIHCHRGRIGNTNPAIAHLENY